MNIMPLKLLPTVQKFIYLKKFLILIVMVLVKDYTTMVWTVLNYLPLSAALSFAAAVRRLRRFGPFHLLLHGSYRCTKRSAGTSTRVEVLIRTSEGDENPKGVRMPPGADRKLSPKADPTRIYFSMK